MDLKHRFKCFYIPTPLLNNDLVHSLSSVISEISLTYHYVNIKQEYPHSEFAIKKKNMQSLKIFDTDCRLETAHSFIMVLSFTIGCI